MCVNWKDLMRNVNVKVVVFKKNKRMKMMLLLIDCRVK